MFKRRVATLAAVGVLVLTGLAGSAMAADNVPPTAGQKVTCTTGDGKTVEFTAVPADDGSSAVAIKRNADGTVTSVAPETIAAPTEAQRVRPAEKGEAGAQSADDEGVKIERLEVGQMEGGQRLEAVPATKTVPATKADGTDAPELTEPPAGAETISCKIK
ncbi:hypothetical protein ABT294_30425 [Nonomuraea sp. NPDC000554]|uniref:hypothetical protein n=1 Tax=Nonomuraea sp. NPDC000554 TaxID=3154259 RepID=UPI003324DC8E